MSAVLSSSLFFLIEFLIICVGDRVVIGRVPGHRPIQEDWNPQKFPSDGLPYENIAENEIPNRVGFADYVSVNRQPQPSADFVFPDEVFVPLPDRLDEIFSAQDRVPTGNGDKYFYKVLRKEERPEYVDHSINSPPAFIPDIDGRGALDMPFKGCPQGQRRDPANRCRNIISRGSESSSSIGSLRPETNDFHPGNW